MDDILEIAAAGPGAPLFVQAQLALLAGQLDDALMLMDEDFRILYANPFALRISRITSANFNRETLWELYPGVYESPLGIAYREAVATRTERHVHDFYYDPLKTTFDLHIFPMEHGVGVHYRDVTALRAAEASQKATDDELRASEERYRVLTELNPQSLWTADPQGLVLYANQTFLDYIGHEFVPKTGTEYLACFDPADRDRVIETWTYSVSTGEIYDIEARLLRAADGASRWWHLRALPTRDEDGAIQQWLGVANDVHDVHLAAEQLRAQYAEIDRQKRELETIYLGSPIGMALYEPKELRLLRINDREAEILRLPAAEAVGMRYADLIAGVPASLGLMRRALAGETVLNQVVEGVLARSPGEYRYWNVNYSPIFAEDGSVLAVAGATVEITQQKRAEAALIQAEKLAAVGRLASSIAHEINNPLESVMNLLYIARHQAADPEIKQFLDLADQELRRVSIIANQTLRFHKQSSRPLEISCGDLFSTVLSIYEGRLRNSQIAVEKRKRAQRPILCFEGEIRQVLNNLVANAIDAMPSGGRLLVRSREATDWATGRRGLMLTVADTGCGIAPEARGRMFEAFFTTKGFNGTGLGLWISAEIVIRHQGRILLRSSQSEAHRGTVFALFLPFETTPVPELVPVA